MTRQEWLLLLLAFEGAPDGLDPIRIQKGMFLFAETAGVSEQERYSFVPYNYGPMSKAIYTDLDALVDQRMLQRKPVPGATYSLYTPTDEGLQKGGEIAERGAIEDVNATSTLYDIKQRIAGLTFEGLLEEVYAEFPDWATNSVYRRYRRR